ncbi:Uncharacterised protein [Yersinia aldovae]|nr:Uncharacterised protein [Yersinia aldovae]
MFLNIFGTLRVKPSLESLGETVVQLVTNGLKFPIYYLLPFVSC